jgi:GNAT superfamily N-acetyltransferase
MVATRRLPQNPPMDPAAVTSFIRSLAHRERSELDASVSVHGNTTRIVYPAPLAWPWPRRFDYTSEFFCAGPGAASLQEVSEATGGKGEHVVNLFSSDPSVDARAFLDAGYAEAWVSTLLGRALNTPWQRPLPHEAHVHEVASTEDMERHASLAGISNPGMRQDPFIHNLFASIDNEVVAKGQLVHLPGHAAYVSDMFTKPSHRGRGLCHLVMDALEDKARRLGATHTCLAPGQEVAGFGLYAKYGYGLVASRSLLVRRDDCGSN